MRQLTDQVMLLNAMKDQERRRRPAEAREFARFSNTERIVVSCDYSSRIVFSHCGMYAKYACDHASRRECRVKCQVIIRVFASVASATTKDQERRRRLGEASGDSGTTVRYVK